MVTTITLNDGHKMPVIGLGTWRSAHREAEESVKIAIDAGYRHIDTAYVYQNEDEVGAGVRAKLDEGVVKREDLFIVSKLAGIHHAPELVEHACKLSLKKLGLDYLDLYLVHFPVGTGYVSDETLNPVDEKGQLLFSDVDYVDTWRAMENLVRLGLVRTIGLSNFNSEQTARVLANCTIKPAVNQVECHPAFNQKRLVAFSKKHGIVITAYCPLARPKPDQGWPAFLYDSQAQALSQKYGKTSAQVCLRYLIQSGVVPIPKSVTKSRIESNFDVFDFELSEEDMKVMDSYDTPQRIIPFHAMKSHKYFPFNVEY